MPTHPPTSLEEISVACACSNVRRTARAVTQLYDHALAPSGLRATQFNLLVALTRTGPVPFTRLAGILGMDRTTLTRNIAPLERDGLLAMRPGPDRRVKLLVLTERGRRTLGEAIPLWEGAQRRIVQGLGADRWEALRRDMQRVAHLAGEAGPE
jgi:DNA-binding MarR family transcriptional regulator